MIEEWGGIIAIFVAAALITWDVAVHSSSCELVAPRTLCERTR